MFICSFKYFKFKLFKIVMYNKNTEQKALGILVSFNFTSFVGKDF